MSSHQVALDKSDGEKDKILYNVFRGNFVFCFRYIQNVECSLFEYAYATPTASAIGSSIPFDHNRC